MSSVVVVAVLAAVFCFAASILALVEMVAVAPRAHPQKTALVLGPLLGRPTQQPKAELFPGPEPQVAYECRVTQRKPAAAVMVVLPVETLN